jgi:hypothetical protein
MAKEGQVMVRPAHSVAVLIRIAKGPRLLPHPAQQVSEI